MNCETMYVGSTRIRTSTQDVHGEYVSLGSETFYRIANYDRMDPFFMSLVSASNHWLFISSNGGLTAGRQNSDSALFPYYTEDKIHDGVDQTGPKTIIRVDREGGCFLWEPFSRHSGPLYNLSRNLYKNVTGNTLMFEEVNHDLEAVFRYTWKLSDRFGFVKHSELANTGSESISVEILDGLENLLPWGVEEFFQNHFSCLGDAYKDNALDSETGLATFAFSSIPGDSPEPGEALRSTVCWSTCPADSIRLLSSLQLDGFRRGGPVRTETRVCGRRGAYFVHQILELPAGGQRDWLLVADLGYGPSEIAELQEGFAGGRDLGSLVLEDVAEGTRQLTALVARADGLQETGDRLGSAHHFANVLFNVMRGGVFESAYSVPVLDLAEFVRAFNRECWTRHQGLLSGLGDAIDLDSLLEEVQSVGDPVLLRLVSEYLPISFSRRHGDPSRPWNRFSINVKNRDGSRILDYQGNWRDIFQNWEALCLSFPEYLEGVISKFVNTTTADGYNPYRVTKDGYDWEIPNPDEPWAHFGYWGDHQLIYLLKFLEWSRRFHPAALAGMLSDRRFVYADVPYDIKPYRDLLEDPRDSIVYNTDRAESIRARVATVGFDGRYLTDEAGEICRANLTEKLLVPLLAKLGNFVPGAGFWMNTQRPEWNDANNALAGYGVSMVTLYYARRYAAFCLELFGDLDVEEVSLSEEVASWLDGTLRVLSEHRPLLQQDVVGDQPRKSFLDGVGGVAEAYRSGLYDRGLTGRDKTIPVASLSSLLRLVLEYFDQTIELNRREDGLYHAYNVLDILPDAISVERLDPMLEGQVAVLSSGALSPAEALAVYKALRQSDLYRADQHSYLLYPNKVLPAFLEKNYIPPDLAERSQLLGQLLADANRELVEEDVEGGLHFNGLFRNVRDVRATMERLREAGYEQLVEVESELVCEIFESVFDHQKFTGRSGTFYGYEGLGSIYWHMVSKLLLAVQESSLEADAHDDGAFEKLAESYYDVRAGIGFNKSPDVYGAFPTDPYSHTPSFAGAKQPGMTGQVKEEIITRLGELGVTVQDGRLSFHPVLLRRGEFLEEPETFEFYDVRGQVQALDLDAQTLAFTYCQVPIVYRLADEPRLTLYSADGTTATSESLVLDQISSREIFKRTGSIERIEVSLSPGLED